MSNKILVSIGSRVFRSFSYGKKRSYDTAIQLAIEEVWKWMGNDWNPWPHIKGMR